MSLTITSYIGKYYSSKYKYGATENARAGYNARSLSDADKYAVRSALRDLKASGYTEDDEEDLRKKTQAFVETYNRMLDSAGDLDSSDVDRYVKKMKSLTKEQKDNLETLGVTIQSNGKLKVDKKKLEEASAYQFERVFGEESDYGTQLERYMKQADNVIRRKNIGISAADSQLFQSIQETLNDGNVNVTI